MYKPNLERFEYSCRKLWRFEDFEPLGASDVAILAWSPVVHCVCTRSKIKIEQSDVWQRKGGRIYSNPVPAVQVQPQNVLTIGIGIDKWCSIKCRK